jgi:hypothetical protein
MPDTAAARRTLDWIRQHPGRHADYHSMRIPGLHPDARINRDTPFPAGSFFSTSAAVALANGWTVHNRIPVDRATSPDGREMPIRDAALEVLGVCDDYAYLLGSDTEESTEALASIAEGRAYEQHTQQYKPEVAQQVLDLFDQYPHLHYQREWYTPGTDPDGTQREDLPPAGTAGDYPCGTTMCVAGAACHVTGYTLHIGAFVSKDGRDDGVPVYQAARTEMGLTPGQARWLFDSDRTPAHITHTLRTIAAGGHPDFD